MKQLLGCKISQLAIYISSGVKTFIQLLTATRESMLQLMIVLTDAKNILVVFAPRSLIRYFTVENDCINLTLLYLAWCYRFQ